AGGALSDIVLRRTGSVRLARKGLSIAAMTACALLTLSVCLFTDVHWVVFIISAGTFCAAAANPCSCAITINLGGEHAAAVMSLMNMAGNLGAALFPLA